jgi:bifunctional oligoribonuclease and PAP phosphatase NrnA
VAISTHVMPDGDGLGASVALYHALRNAGKICKVLNPDPLPERYRFLDLDETVLNPPKKTMGQQPWDLWVIVDTNDPRRLGRLWNPLSIRSKSIVFLDHHAEFTGAAKILYPTHASVVSDVYSSSIGELLYRIFKETRISPIDQKIALGLYVSVMTDTNSFRYARTTPLAHRIAGEMIERGVNPEEVYQSIYSSKKVSHLQLLGSMLRNVKTSEKGRIAWLEMTRKLRQEHRASSDDTQSFLNLLLLIQDAEVICFFREEDDGKIRVSLKSKGRVVVSGVAMELGGGGHEYAAGLVSAATMATTVRMVLKKLEKLV